MSRRIPGIAGSMGAVVNGYRVAQSSRLRSDMRGLPGGHGAGADWHWRWEGDYYKTVEMARYLDRNDGVVGQAVTRAADLTLRGGMQFDPDTGDETLDDDLKPRFQAWGDDPRQCDVQGRSTFGELAWLTYRHIIVDGDHVVLPLRERMLQLVEGHRMVTPTNAQRRKDAVHCGVRRSPLGRPVEYWLTAQDQGPMGRVDKVDDIRKYAAYDRAGNPQVLHVFRPDRVSQTRGVSCFVRMIDNAMAHGDLQFAMLIKEQAAACVTFFREQAEGSAGAPASGAAAFGYSREEYNRDGSTRTVHDIAPGLEIAGRPGEKLQGFAPNLPGDGFLKHSVQVLTFISVNLGIPVMVLLLDPSATNFSGWRGAMAMAEASFERARSYLVTQFHTPVYHWWLRDELASDPALRRAYARMVAKGQGARFFQHQFTPPQTPYIEPMKDAQADELIIRARLNSHRSTLGARGIDIDAVYRDSVNDELTLKSMCAEAARTANKKYPEAGFTWRDFYHIGAMQGSPPAVSAEKPDAGSASGDKKEDLPQESTKTDSDEGTDDA